MSDAPEPSDPWARHDSPTTAFDMPATGGAVAGPGVTPLTAEPGPPSADRSPAYAAPAYAAPAYAARRAAPASAAVAPASTAPAYAVPASTAPASAAVAPVVVRSRGGGGLLVNALLGVALVVAVGGVAFAVGRATAPASAASTGTGRFGTNGQGFVPGGGGPNASGAPGGLGGFGGFAGGASIQGTVTAVSANSITLQLASGQSVTIPLDAQTTWHERSTATAADVTTGSTVIVQVSGGRGAFGNGNGNGGQGNGGQGNGPTGSGAPVGPSGRRPRSRSCRPAASGHRPVSRVASG